MSCAFSAWSRMISAGWEMQSTWLRSIEMLQASRSVIHARTDLMRAAVSAPLSSDYAELSRMAPEKVEAFSRSVQAVARDTLAMQTAWAAQMQRVGMMMLAGRVPSAGKVTTLSEQSVKYGLDAMTAGAQLNKRALAPVHRTATRNAGRLKRARAR